MIIPPVMEDNMCMNFPYIIDEKFSTDYVFENLIILDPNAKKLREVRTTVGTFLVRANSDRYVLFKEKGLKCVRCSFVATYAKLTVVNETKAHFNFYGIDDDGQEIMLTKDHIIPKSFSNANNNLSVFIDTQSNYQPMCKKCNTKKKDDLDFDLCSDPNGVIPDGFKSDEYVVVSYRIPHKQSSLKFPLNRMSVKVLKNGSYVFLSYIRILYDYFNSIQIDELINIEFNLEKRGASNFNNVLASISGTFFI
jgi:hypothetical protein